MGKRRKRISPNQLKLIADERKIIPLNPPKPIKLKYKALDKDKDYQGPFTFDRQPFSFYKLSPAYDPDYPPIVIDVKGCKLHGVRYCDTCKNY